MREYPFQFAFRHKIQSYTKVNDNYLVKNNFRNPDRRVPMSPLIILFRADMTKRQTGVLALCYKLIE